MFHKVLFICSFFVVLPAFASELNLQCADVYACTDDGTVDETVVPKQLPDGSLNPCYEEQRMICEAPAQLALADCQFNFSATQQLLEKTVAELEKQKKRNKRLRRKVRRSQSDR